MSQVVHNVIEDTVVCHCFRVRASTIQDCVTYMGAESLQEVKSLCNAGGGCRSCRSRIQSMIAQHAHNKNAQTPESLVK